MSPLPSVPACRKRVLWRMPRKRSACGAIRAGNNAFSPLQALPCNNVPNALAWSGPFQRALDRVHLSSGIQTVNLLQSYTGLKPRA